MKWVIIENIVTIIAIAAIIVGVYAFGGGAWGFAGLILMMNLRS